MSADHLTDETPDPLVAAMGHALERGLRKIARLDADVRRLAQDVTALRNEPDARRPRRARPPCGPGCWPTSPSRPCLDLAELSGWVNAVYLRYPDATLSSCWLWHPHVIEELWWLRYAHADAYHPENGSWLRVGDWHDRQRPGVAQRVRSALSKCELSRHVSRNGRPAEVAPPLDAPLTGHAVSIAEAWDGRSAAVARTDCRTAGRGRGLPATAVPQPMTRLCSVADCSRRHYGHGFCRAHHARWRRHGDPQASMPIERKTTGGVGYWAAHQRVIAERGPAAAHRCACGAPAREWSYDGADPAERAYPARGWRYSLDPIHYLPRCRSCHRRATLARSPPRRPAPSVVDVERVARLYRAGATAPGIAALLGTSRTADLHRAQTPPRTHPTPRNPINSTPRTAMNALTEDQTHDRHRTEEPNTTTATERKCTPTHRDQLVAGASPAGPRGDAEVC